MRLLIVDDEESVTKAYLRFCNKRGIETTVAANGTEALRIVVSNPPDVILLDISMPGIEGRDVLVALQANVNTRRIPVVVVTALGGDEYLRRDLLQHGAREVIEKPADVDLLLNLLQHLAWKSRTGDGENSVK